MAASDTATHLSNLSPSLIKPALLTFAHCTVDPNISGTGIREYLAIKSFNLLKHSLDNWKIGRGGRGKRKKKQGAADK